MTQQLSPIDKYKTQFQFESRFFVEMQHTEKLSIAINLLFPLYSFPSYFYNNNYKSYCWYGTLMYKTVLLQYFSQNFYKIDDNLWNNGQNWGVLEVLSGISIAGILTDAFPEFVSQLPIASSTSDPRPSETGWHFVLILSSCSKAALASWQASGF